MIIDSAQDLTTYQQEVANKTIVVIPLLCNSRDHFVSNSVLALYVRCDNSEYVFPYKHPESLFKDYSISDIIKNTNCYFYNKFVLLYNNIECSNVYDLELAHYLNTIEPLNVEYIDTEYFYHRLYAKFKNTNNLVSISNFVKHARAVADQANLSSTFGLDYYSNLQSTFHKIEKNGLQVDTNYFIPLYGTPINLLNNKVYTKYNFFTTTGRPSNRFGGINFAALPKQDDTRMSFVSRFTDGKLVELDFKAYHPHIIAFLCEYDFGDENVYEHLAKYYFNTTTPSKSEVTNAKEFTFNQIYGGINKKYLHIEFFAKAKAYTDLLWQAYKQDGFITSNISGRRFFVTDDEITDTKLFNYFIQMTETELNGLYLNVLFNEVDFDKAVPILYTYDAVVFDCNKEYIDELVNKIITSTTKKFPISVKFGDNYKKMRNYNYEATAVMHLH